MSSTRDEYVALIDKLKASASRKPKLKTEIAHQNLISILEGRIEVIDKELAVRFFGKQQRSDSRLQVVARHFVYSLLYFSCFFVLPLVCETYTCFQRIQRARKKVEQRNMFLAQAEIRQTRTRRQTRRPDYVYYDIENSDVRFPNSGLIRVLAE